MCATEREVESEIVSVCVHVSEVNVCVCSKLDIPCTIVVYVCLCECVVCVVCLCMCGVCVDVYGRRKTARKKKRDRGTVCARRMCVNVCDEAYVCECV